MFLLDVNDNGPSQCFGCAKFVHFVVAILFLARVGAREFGRVSLCGFLSLLFSALFLLSFSFGSAVSDKQIEAENGGKRCDDYGYDDGHSRPSHRHGRALGSLKFHLHL